MSMASGSTSCRNVSTSTHVGYVYKILKIVGGLIHSFLSKIQRKKELRARSKMQDAMPYYAVRTVSIVQVCNVVVWMDVSKKLFNGWHGMAWHGMIEF